MASAVTSTPMPSPGMTAIRIWGLEICRIDLRALQLAAEIHVDRLPFGEHVERRGAGFTMAVARRLRSAERQVDLGADRRRVDVEDSRVHVAHGRERPVHVLSVDRRGEAILHPV